MSDFATLNANYLQVKLKALGYSLAYPERLATHEFIVSLQKIMKTHGVNTMDLAKRLLDFNIHAPTTYFPLLVPECLLIEPTETEDKAELDHFIEAMRIIFEEITTDPERVKTAPHTMCITRLDDVKAAKTLDIKWKQD